MAFNFGAGIAEAGKAVADTAGKWTLEAQRADLAQQGIRLADELAGKRDETQRGFLDTQRVETQKFQKEEKGLDRTHGEKLAQLQADTAIKTAGISAGASKYAADLGASERQKDRDQAAPLVAQQTLAGYIKNQNEQNVLDARKEIQEARASGDPARIRAAQQREYDATYSSQAQVQQISLLQAQAKLHESAVTQLQTKLVQMQDMGKTSTPEGKALATTLEAQLRKAQNDFAASMKAANDALKSLPAYSPPGVTPTGAPDLSKYLQTPPLPPPPRVTGAPQKQPGLIDTPNTMNSP